MKAGEACNRLVIYVASDKSVHHAAELMRKYHVGYLVVTAPEDGDRVPIGTVTDRDVVLETVAVGVNPDDITVGDIMDPDPPLVANAEDELAEVLESMRSQCVRRVPVVDAKRELIGVLSLDDVLQWLSADLGMIADIVGNQRRQETKARA